MHDLGALPSACHSLDTNHYANLARGAPRGAAVPRPLHSICGPRGTSLRVPYPADPSHEKFLAYPGHLHLEGPDRRQVALEVLQAEGSVETKWQTVVEWGSHDSRKRTESIYAKAF
jgi:hypothetical protein